MRKKRTEITIEISERMLVKKEKGESRQCWCEACGEEVAMVTAEQAAAIANISPRTIYRWIEEGNLHFVEVQGGSLLVCANSLGQSLGTE